MNNSVFGKAMENVCKHKTIDLVHMARRAQKLVATPAFKRFIILTEDLVEVERIKTL